MILRLRDNIEIDTLKEVIFYLNGNHTINYRLTLI